MYCAPCQFDGPAYPVRFSYVYQTEVVSDEVALEFAFNVPSWVRPYRKLHRVPEANPWFRGRVARHKQQGHVRVDRPLLGEKH